MATIKPVKAWALVFDGEIRSTNLLPTRKCANSWQKIREGSTIIPVLITPIEPKKKGGRK